LNFNHFNGSFHRTNNGAQVASNTVFLTHYQSLMARDLIALNINTLVRGVFAGDVALVAVNASVLMNTGYNFVIQV
jgi:hypothetical protein